MTTIAKKELMKVNAKINENIVMNRWEIACMFAETKKEATRNFIQMFGNYGKMQVTALRKEKKTVSRDLAVTIEPKEENMEEFQYVLRHVMFKNQKVDGLKDNTLGSIIKGTFELSDFDGLWDAIQEHDDNGYVVG